MVKRTVVRSGQNFHTTKKIPDEQRLNKLKVVSKSIKTKKQTSTTTEEEEKTRKKQAPTIEKEAKKRKKLVRPRLSLKNSLSNLHLLLRVPSFNRWPLALRFLCRDVHEKWVEYSKSANGVLRDGFRVFRDFEDFVEPTVRVKSTAGEEEESPTMAILERINVTYTGLKVHIAKSLAMAAEIRTHHCSICEGSLDLGKSMFLVCPSEQCSAVSHMPCLGTKWLQNQPTPGALLPISGPCPQCCREHQWVDLVKEATMRARGEKHLAMLMKEPRVRKTNVAAKSACSNDTDTEIISGSSTKDLHVLLKDSLKDIDLLAIDSEDDPLPEAWQEEVDDDDNMSVTSTESGIRSRGGSPERSSKQRQKLEIVIEDSEWDSAEVLD
ncbi:MAG: hypothetical protein Q9168_005879 [Polycauliona sp. 1 TL-2023]